jgi:CDP-glucose 4,6-dehydratase
VFLTGHTGFKGSWLSLWLDTLGADVTGFALEAPTQPNLFGQASVAKTLNSIIGDIRDYDRLKRAVNDARPEVVIHMAAQSVVKRGYSDPIETYAANVMGTVHLFEAIRHRGEPCVVVNVTSDKCYAHRTDGPPYRENDPMGGDDPYSNSKGCAELVTTAWRASYFSQETIATHGVALGSARAGNAIGGGDWTADQLIPDLIRAFVAGKACPIRRPNAIRPWQFVLEPLRGYLLLAERLHADGAAFASGWNFGPADDDARPVSWIADRLKASWGGGAAWTLDEAAHPSEAAVLRLDATKARLLGWKPALPLGGALDWIVEWYRDWQDEKDMGRTTRDQLARYTSLLRA